MSTLFIATHLDAATMFTESIVQMFTFPYLSIFSSLASSILINVLRVRLQEARRYEVGCRLLPQIPPHAAAESARYLFVVLVVSAHVGKQASLMFFDFISIK